jgi:hypothetical protein
MHKHKHMCMPCTPHLCIHGCPRAGPGEVDVEGAAAPPVDASPARMDANVAGSEDVDVVVLSSQEVADEAGAHVTSRVG